MLVGIPVFQGHFKKSCCCACSCIFLQLFFCTQASEECCAAAYYINCLFLKPPFLTCTLPSHSVAPFDRWWARLLALYICTHFGCLQALFGKSLLPLQVMQEKFTKSTKFKISMKSIQCKKSKRTEIDDVNEIKESIKSMKSMKSMKLRISWNL